jgi:hypothetical protein
MKYSKYWPGRTMENIIYQETWAVNWTINFPNARMEKDESS